jgi:hypothetical protein
MTNTVLASAVIGVGATLGIDLWALLLERGFGIPSLNDCLLGRWFLHMPAGTFVHSSIVAAEPKNRECAVGWAAHYAIGISLALAFGLMATTTWLERPTLLPALAFGLATSVFPLFVMQPSLGLGFASSRAPKPNQARVKSLMTHAVFGLGLYLMARLFGPWLVRSA